jgi:hypothetical protein
VPALSSSLINPALDQLAALPDLDRELLAGRLPNLLHYLAWVPDPRERRGIRHSLVSMLGLATAAVLAGSRGFTAIGEWVLDASPQVWAVFGVRRDRLLAGRRAQVHPATENSQRSSSKTSSKASRPQEKTVPAPASSLVSAVLGHRPGAHRQASDRRRNRSRSTAGVARCRHHTITGKARCPGPLPTAFAAP